MNYKMEELVPIVGKLAGSYTSFESTSITYERAEQLMRAVLYCIHETESDKDSAAVCVNRISAERAFETGLACVERKVKRALSLYNEMQPDFLDYGNQCLHDTVIKGIPEFFKWYDMKYEPQNTVIMLDYPVLRDLSGCSGIDKIYEYIRCICWEQEFLHMFPEKYVTDILLKKDSEYEELIENICEAVLLSVISLMLRGKAITEDFSEADYIRLQEIVSSMDLEVVKIRFGEAATGLLEKAGKADSGLLGYLTGAVKDFAVRLKHASSCR